MASCSFHKQAKLVADRRRCGRGASFTLAELLVAISVISLLLAILLPALSSVRQQAKSLLCMNNMRTVAFSFRLFADPDAHGNRGDSETQYGSRFSAWDFQESLYQASEFWPTTSELLAGRAPYRRGRDAVLCSAVPIGLACVHPDYALKSGQAVAPAKLVSYAMNKRLVDAPYEYGGMQLLKSVTIGERVLNHPNVPLMFDVDAEAAVARWGNKGPFFSAPPGKTPSAYDGTPSHPAPYWFPAYRHRGKITVCFVGGHVVSSDDPLSDPTWDWEYHPAIDH